MKRRNFVRNTSLILGGTALNAVPSFSRRIKTKHRSKKIVIVGAGLSGLIAGHELKRQGHEVTLLEARATSGGRIRTIREPFADGLHAEVGASRIHQDHHLVLKYAKQFGLSLVPFYPQEKNDLLLVQGKHKRFEDIEELDYAAYSPRFKTNIAERLHHPIFKIQGGMDLLPRAIAAELSGNIHYGAPVIKLEQDATGVKAYFERADRVHYIEGERLICTLPFSVVKHVEMQPTLSLEKSQAIFQMPYHATCRILYQSRKRFWENKGFNGFAVYPQGEIWHPTFDQLGERGVLAFYPAQYGVRHLSAGDRVDFGRAAIERFFPGFGDHVEGHFSHFWDEDRHAMGAVSMPEALGDLRSSAAKAEGRIHFAGEHLSSAPRWMEGAIESGLRAAQEVHVAI